MTTDPITMFARVAAPPAQVYRALTDESALTEWFSEYAAVSLPEDRYEFWGRFTPHGEPGRQRLLTADPHTALRFEWTLQDQVSIVEITVTAAGPQGTTVNVVHRDPPPRVRDDEAGLHEFWALSLGNLANHVEGRGLVPRCDFSLLPATVARAEVTIEASARRVHEALLAPAELDRWISGSADVEPHTGGRYDFGWDHGPVKILELEPDRTLAYSWHNDGWPDTVVRWELDDSGGHTHLTVIHSGFSDERPADGYQIGWQGFLVALKRLVEDVPTVQPVIWA